MRTVLLIVAALLALLLLLLLIALLRTLLKPQKKSLWQPEGDAEREKVYAGKLSQMVRCETVSCKGEVFRDKFLAFHKELEALFPLVHQHLEKTEIEGSLLFYWKGLRAERPLVLMAHQDVVPAEGCWEHEPFSGDIDEKGRIWGRGSADDKSSLFAIFQAVEELLSEGYTPPQDLYLSASNTEEIGGGGCPGLVAELKRRGVKPFLVNDEGGAISSQPMAGIEGYYAMVGILEKGQGNIIVSARSLGGHASAPPKGSPIPRLAAFICAMEKHYPLKSYMSPPLKTMLSTLGDYSPFGFRFLLSNLWLFKPLLTRLLPALSPAAGALLRTTCAFTMQKGSEGCNVLPQEASVTINMRYIPHQGMEESIEIIRKLAARYHLEVQILDAYDALKPVDTESEAFHLVKETIEEIFPDLPIVPYIMTGGTDARFYEEICDACVRFAPILYGPDQMKGMHGINEYLDSICLPAAVDYYRTLIRKNR